MKNVYDMMKEMDSERLKDDSGQSFGWAKVLDYIGVKYDTKEGE